LALSPRISLGLWGIVFVVEGGGVLACGAVGDSSPAVDWGVLQYYAVLPLGVVYNGWSHMRGGFLCSI